MLKWVIASLKGLDADSEKLCQLGLYIALPGTYFYCTFGSWQLKQGL